MEIPVPRPSEPAKVFDHSCFAMNTRFSLVLVGLEAEQARALAQTAERHLLACERLMSRFDAVSPVSDLNRRAADEKVTPPDALWEILTLCQGYWRQTRGAFDITLWPLTRCWREHLQRAEEPTDETIQRTLLQTGFHRLYLDEAARTVRFQSKGMSIDLGGFGKGYALESVAVQLRAAGVERAFLSFGESSITVLGSHPHGPAWPVGVGNLFSPQDAVHTFQLRDASLSTSGTAPFNAAGGPRAFGQIIDPRSGRPIEGYRTMSVASPGGMEAEVLSTALLITPAEQRAELLSDFSAVSGVEIVYDSNAGEFVPRIEWKYGS